MIKQGDHYIQFVHGIGYLTFFAIDEKIMRCVYSKTPEFALDSMFLESSAQNSQLPSAVEANGVVVISHGCVEAQVFQEDGRIVWKNTEGEIFVENQDRSLVAKDVIRYRTSQNEASAVMVKTVDGERAVKNELIPYTDRSSYRGKLFFRFSKDEAVYGLGQGEDGVYNYRNRTHYLYQHNMRIPIPFFMSSKGYGILINCGSLMTYQDEGGEAYFFLDTVDTIDYFFCAGPKFDDIIAGFRQLTGRAAMLPKWALGYMQSKERYTCQQDWLDVAGEYRRRGIPLDCIIQDWKTWRTNLWGEKEFDPERFPEPESAIASLHEQNVHLLVSIWPNMGSGGPNHEEFKKAGYLLEDGSVYNAFIPEAQDMYWRQADEAYFQKGVDGWWCDSSEPYGDSDWNGEEKREPWERYVLVGEQHKKYLDPASANLYTLPHTKGIYENQRKTNDSKRVVILTRSVYASMQKYGTISWSGDISASWETLRKQVTEGINMCMSGMPYWSVDIGAFFTVKDKWQNRGCDSNTNPNKLWFWNGDYNEGVNDMGYRELYVRWLQYSTFLPVFRSHGTDTPREIWRFGEEGEPFYDAIAKFIRLRYTLMPYLYSLAGRCTLKDYTIHRSLMFDFASDPNVREISNQFMMGEALLVCPVLRPMYYGPNSHCLEEDQSVSCYLPDGSDWFDYWSREKYAGGQYITVDAPLDRIPLFVKGGSIIPVAEGLQYADEPSSGSMVIMIYPGADSQFLLYEDEGNGYGYESGAFSTIVFEWNDNDFCLTIKQRNGDYPGLKVERQFLIIEGNRSVLVNYDGREMGIKLNVNQKGSEYLK